MGGTVKFFAQSFAQLQTLVVSLSVPGEGFQFPVPPGWESGRASAGLSRRQRWRRSVNSFHLAEDAPPTQNPQERWGWGLKEQKAGARSQLQVPCVEAWVLG